MRKPIAIVGSPNVGKSALFNALSGHYVVVSNYPGTSVEVTRADIEWGGLPVRLTDTPGLYSLFPITEEERVTQRILLDEAPEVVVHVLDARNLDRMLPMTRQLLEAGLNVVLALNMIDEAEAAGLRVDEAKLSGYLGIPVVSTSATSGRGVEALRSVLCGATSAGTVAARETVRYPEAVEQAIAALAGRITGFADELRLTSRSVALWLLRGDEELKSRLKARSPDLLREAEEASAALLGALPHPLDYYVALAHQEAARALARSVTTESARPDTFRERLSRWMMRPLTGLPILALVLYLGLYKFVGAFGAGTVVDFLDRHVFENVLNPAFVRACAWLVPWEWGRTLFVGEYGILTMGLRYAVAIILPIVAFFFLVFAVIEDSGYLPRLAMLIDRAFKKIGLSGRAVIPMVLGLGCVTMATMVTRTLATRRERFLATLLLALAVPCSAQLGVIIALLSGRPAAVAIWTGVLLAIFLAVGWLAARVIPGERPSFYMEIPPLRIPTLSNVLTKTYTRVIWYLKEVLPMFILASVLIWIGQLTGALDWLIGTLAGPMRLLGLPEKVGSVFVLGFFRRDYGVAGLYDMNHDGLLDGTALVVASVGLTLFLPCIAQLLMTVKERGWRAGVGICLFVLGVSYVVSYGLNQILRGLGVPL